MTRLIAKPSERTMYEDIKAGLAQLTDELHTLDQIVCRLEARVDKLDTAVFPMRDRHTPDAGPDYTATGGGDPR
jgi:hypothetical protein